LAVSEPVPLSLYVHVPLCAAKCRYCDFFSVPIGLDGGSESLAARVVAETLAQLGRFLDRVPGASFDTVYVGGGTPSVLPVNLLERLLGGLADLRPSEWTVEANPESLDRGFLDACSRAGVTRLSVGLQSMDDRLLAVLARPATAADNARALELIGNHWRGEASLDLIAGIPGQSIGGMLADAAAVAGTGIGHASLYSLTVEPGTPLARLVASGGITLNAADLDDELWFAGRAALEAAGLRQYEVSNYARPGKQCRHNLRYWHLEPYLGVGPGAVSTLPPDLAGALTGIGVDEPVARLSNPRDIPAFLAGAGGTAGSPWGVETEGISPSAFVLETLMVGLRLVEGISAESFRGRFGLDLDRLVPGLWRRWQERGLASTEEATLRLTDRGLLRLDPLLGELAGALRPAGQPAISVRWPDRAPHD